jgi:hypothetical protein
MGAEPATERAGFIARMPAAQSSASKTPRVKLLQDGLAQDVEIALGGPGALDHSHENDFMADIAVATCKPKAHASHFATAGMRLGRCRGCHNGNLRPILNVESR